MLNDEQRDHLRSLAEPGADVCGCGWHSTVECRLSCHSASQRPEDRLYMEGRKDGRKTQYALIEASLNRLLSIWGSAAPVDTRDSGRLALRAALREIAEHKPRD